MVRTVELVVVNGLLKSMVHFPNPVAEDVVEADKDWELDTAGLKLLNQLGQVDSLVQAFVGHHGQAAGFVDPEVAFAPISDPVGVQGIGNFPLAKKLRVSTAGHRPQPSQGNLLIREVAELKITCMKSIYSEEFEVKDRLPLQVLIFRRQPACRLDLFV